MWAQSCASRAARYAGSHRSIRRSFIDVPLTMTRTIATSHAQNDAGVFELNFRDKHYLPFEGAGAVNTPWSLELPSQLRMFDYDSLSDVIINLSYTARYDDTLSQTVETNIVDQMKAYAQAKGLFRLISLRHEFPDAYYQLMNPPMGQAPATSFTLESRHFPMWLSDQIAAYLRRLSSSGRRR